jgi:phage tail protein X
MPKTYSTISGDMWDMIAKKMYDNEMYTDVLIKANIKHRNVFMFPAGVKLTVPDVPVKPPEGLPPWKKMATL